MRLGVPYYAQTTPYTCGVATLRMLLAWHGLRETKQTLRTMLGVNPRTGASRKNMVQTLRSLGVRCSASSHGTPENLRLAIHNKQPILINFIEPSEDVGHYALVIGCTASSFILHDPWNGERITMSSKELAKRWMKYKTGTKGGWMITTSIKAHSSH